MKGNDNNSGNETSGLSSNGDYSEPVIQQTNTSGVKQEIKEIPVYSGINGEVTYIDINEVDRWRGVNWFTAGEKVKMYSGVDGHEIQVDAADIKQRVTENWLTGYQTTTMYSTDDGAKLAGVYGWQIEYFVKNNQYNTGYQTMKICSTEGDDKGQEYTLWAWEVWEKGQSGKFETVDMQRWREYNEAVEAARLTELAKQAELAQQADEISVGASSSNRRSIWYYKNYDYGAEDDTNMSSANVGTNSVDIDIALNPAALAKMSANERSEYLSNAYLSTDKKAVKALIYLEALANKPHQLLESYNNFLQLQMNTMSKNSDPEMAKAFADVFTSYVEVKAIEGVVQGAREIKVAISEGMVNPAFEVNGTVIKNGNVSADMRKFTEYIFKDGAAPGKDVVYKNLGYSMENSEALTKNYIEQAMTKYKNGQYQINGDPTQYGLKINIEIELTGIGDAAGKTSYLKSGWMIRPDGSITLNTPFSGFTK